MGQQPQLAAFLGLALGDAYGRSLEFVTGPRVRTRPVAIPSSDFMWTDDTHMARYLMDAIERLAPAQRHPLCEDAFGRAVGEAFVDWAADPLTPSTAPGNTCLQGAAAFSTSGDWRTSGVRHSDGCGAVMRIAPLSLVWSGAELVAAARVQAVVTHAHPNAPAAAVAGSLLLRRLLDGASLEPATVLEVAHQVSILDEGTPTVVAALEAAVAQAGRDALPWLDERHIPDGDGGWRSPSALGLAVVAALRWGDDFRVCVDKAARIDGDSDSVACLAGMLVGAAGGVEALPEDWLAALPRRAWLEEGVQVLLTRCQPR